MHIHEEVCAEVRAATADFRQARLPRWLQHCRRATTATAAFHFAKSRQDLGDRGPGSLYGRMHCCHFVVNCGGNCRPENQTWVATISNVTLPLYVVTNLNYKFMTILHLPDNSLTSVAQSICTHYSCFESFGRFVTLKKIGSGLDKVVREVAWFFCYFKREEAACPQLFYNATLNDSM